MPSILILGAGFGGLAASHTLRHLLSKEHSITVIDKSPHFHVGATKTWVMLGSRTVESINRERTTLLPSAVDFVHADITSVNPDKGEVMTARGIHHADYLIIALGADVTMEPIPGLADAAETFYTVEGAPRLRDALNKFGGGELVFLIPRTPFKCPPGPYEGALLVEDWLRRKGLREKTRVSFYTVEPAPMPTAGSEMGSFIRGMLEERGIVYHPSKKTVRIEGRPRKVHFEDGTDAHYDLLVAIPPHVAPRVVRDAGLTNESGWVPVDSRTMRVKRSAGIPIYAVGDITTVSLPGRFKPDVSLVLPKAGVFAASHGEIAARQVAGEILGKASTEYFDGRGFCYIEVGEERAIRGDGSFFELPHPVMKKRLPDQEQYRDKVAWVEKWLGGRILR